MLTLLLIGESYHPGQAQTVLQLYGGFSHHFPSEITLYLNHQGYRLSQINPLSHSLEFPLYYGFSMGQWLRILKRPVLLQLEFLHDKLYLPRNQTVKVEESTVPDLPPGKTVPFGFFLNHFSMTHGYNFLLLKIGIPLKRFSFSQLNCFVALGGGGTIPHVESQQGNQKLEQYEVHGPAAVADLQFSWQLNGLLALLATTKLTFARIRDASLTGGTLSGHFWSWHFNLGIQLSFPAFNR